MSTELIIEAIRREDDNLNVSNKKFPCSICNKNVLNNQKAIQCDSCNLWCHIKCDGTSSETYNYLLLSDETVSWHCLLCKIKFHHINFPFTLCDDIEINNMNNSNSMKFCDSLSKFEVVAEASKFSNYTDNDPDYNLPISSSCRYYTINEIQNLKTSSNLNIFHTNINGLESKIDHLNEFVSNVYSDLDIIAITETSHKSDNFFTTNVNLTGFKEFYTPSNSSKGGTALYVKEIYEAFERNDLKSQNDYFESVWIEVKNKHKKNIICSCIYRHPNYEISEFINYMESTLKKLSDENKEVYMW